MGRQYGAIPLADRDDDFLYHLDMIPTILPRYI